MALVKQTCLQQMSKAHATTPATCYLHTWGLVTANDLSPRWVFGPQ